MESIGLQRWMPDLDKTRYHDLDALRAFAMLLGIVLHGLASFTGWPIWNIHDIYQSELYGIPMTFIHGFRMPLFFFVSGFFTMMAWQGRGSRGLLVHRGKRIVLPFFVFGLFIFPIQKNTGTFDDWINKAEKEEKKEFSNIGQAARHGDSEAIGKFLSEGADIDGTYDNSLTPLQWASTMGQSETVKLLANKGAEVNLLGNIGNTPLHFATFFGRTESVRVLLENGADPELRNHDGNRPVDLLMDSRETTQRVARNLLQISISWDDVKKGRKEVMKLLVTDESSNLSSMEGMEFDEGNWFTRNYFINGQLGTFHLWFLYYLVYLTLAFVLLAKLLSFARLPGLAKWLAESPFRLLWLLPLTFWAQYFMGDEFGPSTSVNLIPHLISLGYYGLFFGYGAICFANKGFHQKVGRSWPINILVSLVVFVIALSLMERKDVEWRYELITLCSALFVWLMIFGLMGVFRKFFSGENPKIRFVSDSAYWLYIAHLPLVKILQALVSYWEFPSILKFILVCFLTTTILLLSYRYFIRYTWIGTMLNGKRYRANGAI